MLKRDYILNVFLFTEGSATTHPPAPKADGIQATLWRNPTGFSSVGQSQPLLAAPGWLQQDTKNKKASLLHSQSLTTEEPTHCD